MMICHNTFLLEKSLLKTRQFQEENNYVYYFFN